MSERPEPGIRQTVYKQPGGYEPAEATEAVSVHADRVQGEIVIVRLSEAEHVAADRVTVEQSAVDAVEARSVQLQRCRCERVDAERAVALHSRIGRLSAGDLRLVRSWALAVFSDQAHLEESRVLVFAGRADGDVRPVLTVPAAALTGAVAGIVLGILVLLAGLVRDRR